MRKSDAIVLFGTGTALASAVGLSRSRISQWPEKLTQKQQDLVTGAAVRLGKISPRTQPAVHEKRRATA